MPYWDSFCTQTAQVEIRLKDKDIPYLKEISLTIVLADTKDKIMIGFKMFDIEKDLKETK